MPEVRAMQLWSDWNADVHEWGSRHNAVGDPSFEHLTVHTEDLIDPDTKFEAVRQVAAFVGSLEFTNDELCCMVVQPEEFMGSHSVKGGRGATGNAAADKLKARFGHWHDKVAGRPDLSAALHKEGARGLKDFGYEPELPRTDLEPLDGYRCTLTPESCAAMGIKDFQGKGGGGGGAPAKATGSAEVPPDDEHCHFAKVPRGKGERGT